MVLLLSLLGGERRGKGLALAAAATIVVIFTVDVAQRAGGRERRQLRWMQEGQEEDEDADGEKEEEDLSSSLGLPTDCHRPTKESRRRESLEPAGWGLASHVNKSKERGGEVWISLSVCWSANTQLHHKKVRKGKLLVLDIAERENLRPLPRRCFFEAELLTNLFPHSLAV